MISKTYRHRGSCALTGELARASVTGRGPLGLSLAAKFPKSGRRYRPEVRPRFAQRRLVPVYTPRGPSMANVLIPGFTRFERTPNTRRRRDLATRTNRYGSLRQYPYQSTY